MIEPSLASMRHAPLWLTLLGLSLPACHPHWVPPINHLVVVTPDPENRFDAHVGLEVHRWAHAYSGPKCWAYQWVEVWEKGELMSVFSNAHRVGRNSYGMLSFSWPMPHYRGWGIQDIRFGFQHDGHTGDHPFDSGSSTIMRLDLPIDYHGSGGGATYAPIEFDTPHVLHWEWHRRRDWNSAAEPNDGFPDDLPIDDLNSIQKEEIALIWKICFSDRKLEDIVGQKPKNYPITRYGHAPGM